MSFWKHVNQVLKESDIILIVLDCRMPEKTLNQEILNKTKDKKFIYVLNKADLVSIEEQDYLIKKFVPSILTSPIERYGTQKLKEKIMILAKKEKMKFPVTVGIVGYPNTGKSTLINVLKGSHSASTSSSSGHTKGMQILKVNNNIRVIDTPGVIDKQEKHSFTGGMNINKIKDPELEVFKLIEEKPGLVKDNYEVEENEDLLEVLALKLNFLKKQAQPDTERVAKKILQDYIKGKLV